MRQQNWTPLSLLQTTSFVLLALQVGVTVSTPATRASTTVRPSKERQRQHTDPESYRPRNVSVQVINSTTIRVQWDHPRATATIATVEGVQATTRAITEQARCPTTQYTIRLKSDVITGVPLRHGGRHGRGKSSTRTLKVDGTRRSVTLNDLTPSTSYHVRVLATACDGTRGKPSPWIGLHTGPATTGVVLGSTGILASNLETGNRRLNDDDDDDDDDTYDDDDNADEGGIGDQTVNDETDSAVPGKPTYVRTRTFSDSVMVSWLPPDDGSVVRGYMVGYGEGVPDVNWQYVDATRSNVTIKNLTGDVRTTSDVANDDVTNYVRALSSIFPRANYTTELAVRMAMASVEPATQYIVSLRAFNNHGKGPVIYDLIYTRDVSGPTMNPPTDLKSKILSSTTLWLQWIDPTLGQSQQPTDNRYYNIHYRALAGTSGWTGDMATGSGNSWAGLATKTLSLIVKEQHVVFYDLHPGTRYEFKVRTVKDAVASVFSEPIINKTFETAPSSPPRNVAVMATNQSGTVRVTWKAPRLPNGDITGYLVLYTQSPDLALDRWQSQQVYGAQTEAVIGNLLLGASYHFRIQALNSAGSSPTSSNVVFYAIPYHNAATQGQSPSLVTSSPSTATGSPFALTSSTSIAGNLSAQNSTTVTVSSAASVDAGNASTSKKDTKENGEGVIDSVIAEEQGDEHVQPATIDDGAQNMQQMDAAATESTAWPTTVVVPSTTAGQQELPTFQELKSIDTSVSGTGSGKSPKSRGGISKSKRQPDDGPVTSHEAKPYFDVPLFSDKQQQPAERKSVKAKSPTTTASELVKFQVLISHEVSAYITWPEQVRCSGSDSANGKRVIGYQLRYYSGEATITSGGSVATTPTVLNLTNNVALIDNLRPNIEYWYQLKYVYDDGSDSGWGQQQLIDTR